jgi:hypothetical protein
MEVEVQKKIFVFGSNLAGRHGKGAALTAYHEYGAVYGAGVGRMGQAYAIPTKDHNIRTLPLGQVENSIIDFVAYAQSHQELEFYITRVGCGLAGFMDDEIGPNFARVPPNCQLPPEWEQFRHVCVRDNQNLCHVCGWYLGDQS